MRIQFQAGTAVLLTAAVLLIVSSTAGAASAALEGQVVDAQNKRPVPSALVLLRDAEAYEYTDRDGRFSLSHVPPGSYLLEISRIGYEPVLRRIDIGSQAAPATYELSPKPIAIGEILVTAAPEHTILQTDILADQIREQTPKDVGKLMKDAAGFGVVRRGGYALDPVLRSFKNEQLNVQFDGGVRVSNACPNRMDPPTAHVVAEDLEKVEVIKGPYTVRFGQSLGGIVNLVTRKPSYSDRPRVRSALESGYDSNGGGKRGRVTLMASGPTYDGYFSSGLKDFGNYESGSGQEIRSRYESKDYSLKVGVKTRENQRLQLTWRQSFVRDVLYPGLPMDSQKDDTNIFALDYQARNPHPLVTSLTAKVYGTWVDHLMDNTLRPNYGAVHAVAPVETRTLGGRFELTLNPRMSSLWYAGLDFYTLNKDGGRTREVLKNMCTNPVTVFDQPKVFEDFIWQDTDLSDLGLFSEWHQSIGDQLSLVAGVRADLISSGIGSPAPEFVAEYGRDDSWSETNLSASTSLRYRWRPTTTLALALGRGTRTASITERYINHLSVGLDPHEYVGNPDLEHETNNQVEVSIERATEAFYIQADAFYSRLTDHISAYLDTGLNRVFMPCMDPKNAKRFHNVDKARLVGFELAGWGQLSDELSLRGNLSYTRGENLDLDEPLPEITPLEARGALRYTHTPQNLWGEIGGRIAARQERTSDAFAETETPGFAVVDLKAGYRPIPTLELALAVENLLDKEYYEHLNRGFRNLPASEGNTFYESGRNLVMQVRLSY